MFGIGTTTLGTRDRYTIRITDDRVTIAVIWCTLALSAGTKFSKVRIPLTAW